MKSYFARDRILASWFACLLGVASSGVAPVRAQDSGLSLNLICPGSGSVTKNQPEIVSRYDRDDKKFRTETQLRLGKKSFSGTAYVEVAGQSARIRLPSGLLPLIRNSNDGWFVVKDLFIGEGEITGTVRINGLNKKKLRIDRSSGVISLRSGLGDFNGRCDAHDVTQRRF
ncbi:MAG: hypothetical protein KDE14_03105 [Rhodobacteraceae bacterium]|nr:hypothetical protein [Paracoccaceae bacterium]